MKLLENKNEIIKELINDLETAYDALRNEYVSCSYCSGRIWSREERHDDYCPWKDFDEKIKFYKKELLNEI